MTIIPFFFFEALLDNYISDSTKPDPTDAQKSKEEDNFFNTIAVAGGPVDVAFKYLLAKKKTTAAVSSSLVDSTKDNIIDIIGILSWLSRTKCK